jgi:hypothetical protein
VSAAVSIEMRDRSVRVVLLAADGSGGRSANLSFANTECGWKGGDRSGLAEREKRKNHVESKKLLTWIDLLMVKELTSPNTCDRWCRPRCVQIFSGARLTQGEDSFAGIEAQR